MFVLLFGFLFQLSQASIETEQLALDAIAQQIRIDANLSRCIPPDLASCSGSCTGTECGSFDISVDSNGAVTYLLVIIIILTLHVLWRIFVLLFGLFSVWQNSLAAFPTEIALLSNLKSLLPLVHARFNCYFIYYFL